MYVDIYLLHNSQNRCCFYVVPDKNLNPCHAEWIKMPRPLLIFSLSDYLIQVVDSNSHFNWQTVQIQMSWLQKPTDLDLHCLQGQDISRFSRTRVKDCLWKQRKHKRMKIRGLVLLTLVLLNPDMPFLCKQCRSRSVGFWRSQLIWIYTVCH